MAKLLLLLWLVFLPNTGFAGAFFQGKIEANQEISRNIFSSSLEDRDSPAILLGDMKFYLEEKSSKAVQVNRWKDGMAIFEFSEEVNEDEKEKFLSACEGWKDAGVQCKERVKEPNYYVVEEHSGAGCNNLGFEGRESCAPIGYSGPGRKIEIHQSHWNSRSLLEHEIGHVFGLIHEHSRKDRDVFVTVVPRNAIPGTERNFDIIETNLNTDYDYLSIMHYPNCLFSVHSACTPSEDDTALQTIFVHECGLENRVGGQSITDLDIDTLRAAYNPALVSAFESSRRSDCGTSNYSSNQLDLLCSDASCVGSSASPVNWLRYRELSGSVCGFAPIQDYPSKCVRAGQEYIDHWTDTDVCSCGLCNSKFEWWVACGCSQHSVQHKCTDFEEPPTLARAGELANSSDPKYSSVGYLFRKLIVLESQGMVDGPILKLISRSIRDNLHDENFAEKFKTFSAGIRILTAARLHSETSAAANEWRLDAAVVQQFLRRAGFNE